MKKRKIIKIIIIVIVIIAVLVGVIAFFVNRSKKDVSVYSIKELAMDNYWENNMNSEGMVSEDRMQSVYLSESQQVEKIAVKEGQHVRKGDVLLRYSTTLSNIELEKEDLEIKKLELNINKAQKELEEIKNYQPGVPILGNASEAPKPTPKPSQSKYSEPEPKVDKELETVPAPITGNGTDTKPYIFIGKNEYDNSFIEKLINRAGDGKTEVFAIFMDRENGSLDGELIKATKIKFTKKEGGYSFEILEIYSNDNDPLHPEANTDELEDEEIPEVGPTYTVSEIRKLIIDKEKEISEIDLDIKKARNEYKKLKNELNNTVVYSKYDGIVKKVLSLDDDEINSKPVIVVSSGGGFNIQGRVGEFDLYNIHIGQEVNVQSYEKGTMAVGKITQISEYPTSSTYYMGGGNNNVSYYPYIVSVSEDEEFKEGEYVSLNIVQEEKSTNSFFLLGAFVLPENGKNYVYIVGENNKLEKREVSIGKNMQGMLEIKSGITKKDRIAFPYGKNVKTGANVKEGSVDEIYM